MIELEFSFDKYYWLRHIKNKGQIDSLVNTDSFCRYKIEKNLEKKFLEVRYLTKSIQLIKIPVHIRPKVKRRL